LAVASPARARRGSKPGSKSGGGGLLPRPWWGGGASPDLLWPGVTIEIPVRWSAANDRWESSDGRFYFDEAAAQRAVDFFPDLLRHHMGEFAGQPFTLLEYQEKLIVRPLFGWKRASDGLRRFRKVFAFLPKGSGKSPIAAGIGVYLARCDSEMASEVYALANDRNQARTVHTNAKYMVEDSPYLADGAEITKDAIAWADTRSTYMVLSSDASSAHGKRPHGLIFDELHGYAGDRDRELFEALRKSLVKRRQPILLMVSHAGTDDESICREEYDYSHALLSGTIEDETMLPVIFEASPAEDWTDPAVHRRVNPGYGVTVKADAVEMECREALNDPRKRNDFLRYHLNRWVNQATAWIPVEWWDACEPEEVVDWRGWLATQTPELAALPCAAGLDLAQKYDLACLSVVFRVRLASTLSAEIVADSPTGQAQKRSIDLNYRIVIVPFFWIPEETMRQREKEDNVPYSRWVELGLVQPTEGAVIDYSRIYQDITTKIAGLFPRLKEGVIGYDPAFATDLATKLRDMAGFKVEEVLQNYTHLSEAAHIFEALVKGRRVGHGGHRVLRNHVESVAVKTDDAGRIRPVKPKRAGKHIDGVVSSLMGLKMLAAIPDELQSYQVLFFGPRG
jgi:phage terminase large subunit-like protein